MKAIETRIAMECKNVHCVYCTPEKRGECRAAFAANYGHVTKESDPVTHAAMRRWNVFGWNV